MTPSFFAYLYFAIMQRIVNKTKIKALHKKEGIMLNKTKITKALDWLMFQCEYKPAISYDQLWSIFEDSFDLINPHDDYKEALAVYAILANGKWDNENRSFTWPEVELVYQVSNNSRAMKHRLKRACDHGAEWV